MASRGSGQAHSQAPTSKQKSEHGTPRAPKSLKIAKDPSRTRLSGGIFEMQLAGLTNLRLRSECQRLGNVDLRYLIATNMADANPFDDIVLRLAWNEDGRQRALTYFVQMKHSEKASKPVTMHDLTGDVSKRNKDFNLHKYFQFFQEFKKLKDTLPEDLDGNRRLLCEWAQDEYRFVLFTTREVLPRTKDSRATSQLDFPFEEVFSTEQGEVFCFGDQDLDVWNMLQGTDDEVLFRSEFLPRLRIFSEQAQVSSLEPLLVRALAQTVGVPTQRADRLVEKYATLLSNWWSSSEGSCLTEESSEIEEIVRESLLIQCENLLFQKRYVDDLEKSLRAYDVAYIVVPGISPHLRCSKLWPLLDKTRSDRFVIFTESTFGQYSLDILLSLCTKLCDALVLCVDSLTRIVRTLIEKLLSRTSCKVWIVSSVWEQHDYDWLWWRVPLCCPWSECWSLEQLEHEDQQRLLGLSVSFQGHEMALAELREAWPSLGRCVCSASLGSLLVGEQVVIGSPIPQVDKRYLSRTLQHQTAMLPSVFQHCSVEDHFLLSGFPEDILRNLRRPDSFWQECLPTGATLDAGHATKTKWSEWNKEKDFDTVKVQGSGNLHWLSYERQQIIWKGSMGDIKTLKEYTEKKCDECRSEPICCHYDPRDFLDWQDTTLLLADTAGMGKSTFITHMAHVIKNNRKRDWVILVRIKQNQLLEKLPDNTGIREIILMLTETVIFEGKFEVFGGALGTAFHLMRTEILGTPVVKMVRQFITECLHRTGRITILMDGVDEICPAQKTKAFRVLELLQSSLEISGGKLWVTSRTVLEEDLSRLLRCATPHSLQRFSPEDQKKFLLSCWREDLSYFDEEALEDGVSTLVDTVREATDSDGSSICDVPLYTRMLAEVYTGHDLYALFSNTAFHINRIALYTRFVQKTLGTVWEKAGLTVTNVMTLCIESDKSMLEKHKMYAAWECFTSQNLGTINDHLQKAVDELNNDFERERTARTGIITNMVGGRPKFIHYTIGEFLAALWLRDNYHSLQKLAEALYDREQGEVRVFFDSILADGSPLHEAAVVGRLDTMKGLLSAAEQNVDETDAGGRRALHLGVIYGHAACVRFLLDNGADVHARDQVLNWTPMKYADSLLHASPVAGSQRFKKQEKCLKVIEELIAGGGRLQDAKHLLKMKNDILQTALENGYLRLSEALITTNGFMFLQKLLRKEYMEIAAMSTNAQSVALLARLGFKANIELANGETCLHMFAKEGDETTCALLLKHGASVNAKNSHGNSPFDHAAHSGHEKVCQLFLEYGANVTTKNDYNTTALHHVAIGGVEPLCRHILDCGVDVNAANKYGETALSLAASRGHTETCRTLLDNGGDINGADASGHSVLHHATHSGREALCRFLIERGACVNAGNKDSETVLHYAAFYNRRAICRLLLDSGANVNAASRRGDTVLQEAVYKESVCKIILSYGADPNVPNNDGSSPLHKAARSGLEGVCALLLDSGAKVNAQTNLGQTPLYHAARSGRWSACRLLLRRGADANLLSNDLVSPYMISSLYGHKKTCQLLREVQFADVLRPDEKNESLS